MSVIKRQMLAGAVLALFVTLTSSGRAQREGSETVLTANRMDQPVNDVGPMQDVTTEHALATVLSHSGISGGIAEAGSCLPSAKNSRAKHSFVLTGLTTRQALDIIVADDARYRWTAKDHVINLIPVAGVPRVLQTKLSHFEIEPEESVDAVGARLFRSAEIKQALAYNGLAKQEVSELIIGGTPPKIDRTIAFEDVTAMDVLNAAAAANKYPAVWHYTERVGECAKTYDLYWPVGSSVTHVGEHK